MSLLQWHIALNSTLVTSVSVNFRVHYVKTLRINPGKQRREKQIFYEKGMLVYISQTVSALLLWTLTSFLPASLGINQG